MRHAEFYAAVHKHGVVVCEGDAEAAQPRRTRWSHRAHKGEEMLGKECEEVGARCLQDVFEEGAEKTLRNAELGLYYSFYVN